MKFGNLHQNIWTKYIFTESFMMSLTTIFYYLIHKFVNSERGTSY